MEAAIRVITAIQEGDNERVLSLLPDNLEQHVLDSGLCWASRLGNLPLVVTLLERGANPNAEVLQGFTPLMWNVMFSSSVEIVRHLIGCGACVNRCSRKRKQTALHAAIIRGDTELADVLIKASANLDAQDYLSKTPLLHAVQRNLVPCVKLLIKNNCNVTSPGWVNGAYLSPLMVALVQNNLEITKMLVLAGAKFQRTAIYQTYTVMQYYRTVEDNLNMELRPVYLKQQCRVCIRNLLKPQFLEKLREMLLPKPLEEFLSLEELDRIS